MVVSCKRHSASGHISNGPQHRAAYSVWPVQRRRGNARAASAQKCSQSAGLFGGFDNFAKIWNQFGTKRLMKFV